LALDKLARELQRALSLALSKKTRQKIGKATVKSIKTRVRAGSGSPSTGQQEKLKPLEKKTKRNRRHLRSKGGLAKGKTTAAKSNLTQTGSMIDTLNASTRGSDITIRVSPDNQKKANLVSKDRPFLNLTKTDLKTAADVLVKEWTKQFNKIKVG
jgi:hypothetical protein